MYIEHYTQIISVGMHVHAGTPSIRLMPEPMYISCPCFVLVVCKLDI